MRGVHELPEGLRWVEEVLDPDEEQELLAQVTGLELREVRMHGQVARRTVRDYGVTYDFASASVTPGEPVPDWLEPLRVRCAALLERPPDALAEALVTRYPPGATIGWHRDAPVFGDVVGVSLASSCRLRFQRGTGVDRRVFEQHLQPRSAYVLAGRARTVWQHSIPAVPAERWSVTFRTLRRSLAPPSDRSAQSG